MEQTANPWTFPMLSRIQTRCSICLRRTEHLSHHLNVHTCGFEGGVTEMRSRTGGGALWSQVCDTTIFSRRKAFGQASIYEGPRPVMCTMLVKGPALLKFCTTEHQYNISWLRMGCDDLTLHVRLQAVQFMRFTQSAPVTGGLCISSMTSRLRLILSEPNYLMERAQRVPLSSHRFDDLLSHSY